TAVRRRRRSGNGSTASRRLGNPRDHCPLWMICPLVDDSGLLPADNSQPLLRWLRGHVDRVLRKGRSLWARDLRDRGACFEMAPTSYAWEDMCPGCKP